MKKTILAVALALAMGSANAGLIATLEDETNSGGFFADVTFDASPVFSNAARISIDISNPINPGLVNGDILGIFFDVKFENGISFDPVNSDPGGLITGFRHEWDNVTWVGTTNNNMNGSSYIPFDMGVAIGYQGGALGFQQTVSFDLRFFGNSQYPEYYFVNQDVGLRVQSISGSSYEFGSAKLVGQYNEPPVGVPEPSTLSLMTFGLSDLVKWGIGL